MSSTNDDGGDDQGSRWSVGERIDDSFTRPIYAASDLGKRV
jgi:hypothetical protein